MFKILFKTCFYTLNFFLSTVLVHQSGRSAAWKRIWFGTRGSQVQILPPRPLLMKKAKIYKPSKTAMQSGLKKFDKWIIEFITEDPGKNPLMGWESSSDTYSELNLEFKSKDLAIEYAKKNNIDFEVVESQKRKITKKSYADNFIK